MPALPRSISEERAVVCFSLLGVDKVIQYAVNEWLTDIRKNQLPGILGGVGPMHSVVQLCEYDMSHLSEVHCCISFNCSGYLKESTEISLIVI